MDGVGGLRQSGMYIMPTGPCGSESNETKDILDRMQLQVLISVTLKAISTTRPVVRVGSVSIMTKELRRRIWSIDTNETC